MFGKTSKEWRSENPEEAKKHNIRDFADMHQLTVLANAQWLKATLIRQGISAQERLNFIRTEVVAQLRSLYESPYTVNQIQSPFKSENEMSTFNKNLDKTLHFNPKKK